MKHMKLHESFFEGIARVCLTTENTESTELFWRGAGLAASYCDHLVVAMMSVKALLGCFTRRREDAKAGGRVSPRAAFRCAEGWEGRASLVRGQADACPSQRFASQMTRDGGRHLGGAQN
jgi:hypothetical protein